MPTDNPQVYDRSRPATESWVRWIFRLAYEEFRLRSAHELISAALLTVVYVVIRFNWHLPASAPPWADLLARVFLSVLIAAQVSTLLAGLALYSARAIRWLRGRPA
jgi:hypothetical protein